MGVLAIGVLLRIRRAISDWSLAAGLSALSVESIFGGLAARSSTLAELMHWLLWQVFVLSLLPGFWLLFSLTYARGNAREFVSRWRILLGIVLFVPPGIVIGFREHLIIPVLDARAGHGMLRLEWPGILLYLFLLIGWLLILMNLERTFRASVGTIRWRIKFMLLGIGVLFVVRLYTSSQALLFHGLDLSLQSVNAGATLIATLLILRSFFRARHFDMGIYPSQSVLQGSLTVLLAGIYLLVVGVFAKVAAYLGGDAAFGIKAFVVLVSVVVLAVLLQSDRVRLHLNRFVSRNFHRPVYDYRTVWKQFTDATASRVEEADLCRSLVRLTADVFHALSVAIWLLEDDNGTLRLAGSTFLSETRASGLALQQAETLEVLDYLREHPEPVDIESSKKPWAAALRQIHPAEFPNGGRRVCIPMLAHNEVIGVFILGDRVAGTAFSLQDFDMLKCVADHATSSLRNVQLSRALLQAKEMEAFQTMATFFVHDLKNGASTLNLMLQNLPIHFDDPAFREDALRGISKTVTHINRLIGRLSLLRHELKIQSAESDLNEIVTDALAGMEKSVAANLVKNMRPLPKIFLDREQMLKVITNLVINATEAVAREGEVRIATSQTNGSVILAVEDNGPGMSPDFLNRSLFRPFQTTKKTGLGIGLFQSKMIVEAHGGRIIVVSEVGKGTTFQVVLPVRPPAK